MTARDAQSGTRTVRLSGGAPRPVTSTLHSAPIRTAVTRPPAVPLPGFEASLPLSVSGATSARTVAVTPESGGAITSSSYTPGTRSSARRSEEHTSELQSHHDLVCRLLLEKKKKQKETKQI